MKKPLFSLICAVALLFSSCSKENTAAPKDEKLYPVTFNVSTFSKEIVPMAHMSKTGRDVSASSGKALSDAIGSITYAVYSEAYPKVNEKIYFSNNSNFGKIEDALPKGKYTVMIFGAKRTYGGAPNKLNNTFNMTSEGGDDIFFKKIEIEVTGAAIDQAVKLDRKVGKLELNLLDEIPETIESIQYSLVGGTSAFSPLTNYAANGNAINRTNHYWPFDGTMDDPYDQHFDLYFFLDQDVDATGFLTIRAYDQKHNLLLDKTISDIPLAINKKTVLTGRLFDDVGASKGQAFSISVDDKWNSESNHVEF